MPTPLVTPLPALDRTLPDFREDVDTFFASQVPTFTVQINTLADYLVDKSDSATASATAAAGSATSAAAQVGLAAAQVTLATAQAANAADSASDAADSSESAQIYAAAAGAAAGLPALAGNANKSLIVKPDETGVQWGTAIAYAPIDSPVFTGDPRVPTPTLGDNDTSIANTAFVQATVNAAAPAPTVRTITTTASVATTDNRALIVLNGASAFTLSLPAVASVPAGFSFNVRNIAAVGVGTVTIDPNGSELIAGRATIPVYGGEEGFTIQSTGTAWQCVGRAKRVAIGPIAVTAVAQIDIEAPFADPEIRSVDIEFRSVQLPTGVILEARFKISGSYTSYSGYYWGGSTGIGASPPSSNGYNLAAAAVIPSNSSGSACTVTGKMDVTCGPSIEPSLRFVGSRWDSSLTGFGIVGGWSVRNGAASPQGIRLSPASGNFSGGDLYVWGIRG